MTHVEASEQAMGNYSPVNSSTNHIYAIEILGRLLHHVIDSAHKVEAMQRNGIFLSFENVNYQLFGRAGMVILMAAFLEDSAICLSGQCGRAISLIV